MAALVPLLVQLIEPVMTVPNAIPRVILAPLFVIWLGIARASKVALAFIPVAVLIFFAMFSGILGERPRPSGSRVLAPEPF